MRQPLWLLNSALLVLLLIALCIIILLQQRPPRWTSIEPTPYVRPVKAIATVDNTKIYTNDLFDTYQQPVEQAKKKELEITLPVPPTAIAAQVPSIPTPSFLEPLQVSLKGVIMLGDDQKNRAIISNNKTKQELTVKLGDMVEDAQLIRIMRNRVILIRSNGQEELLYLRESDAKAVGLAHSKERWDGIVKHIDDDSFIVDPEAFIETVPTVAQLVEMLHLSTVYRQGKAIGLRIGKFDDASIGHVLDIYPGDIITSINQLPLTTAADRYEAYKKITALPLNSSIKIELLRDNQEKEITIKLQELGKPQTITFAKEGKAPMQPKKTLEEIEQEKIEFLHKKQTFAPTLEQLRKQEKKTMLTKVKRKEQEQQLQQRPLRSEI